MRRRKTHNQLQKQLKNINQELEEKVKTATAEITDIFERFTDAFIGLDKNWNYTYVNRKAAELLKRTAEDLIGKNVWKEYPDAVKLSLYQAYHRAFNQQEYVYHEHYYEPFDVWIENHIYPSLEGVSIIFRDITEKKKAEEKLQLSQEMMKLSEARLKEAQRLAHIGSWNMNFIEDQLDWSDEVYRIFGLEVKEIDISFGVFLSYVHPDDRHLVNDAYENSLEKKNVFDITYRIIAKGGILKYINGKWENLYDDSNNLLLSTGTVQDITLHKLSEQIIKETEKRYRLIVETAQEGIWLIDETNHTTFVNKKMCEIIEYSSEEIIGKKIHDFMDDEGRAKASEQIERRKQGLNENHDSRFITKSGQQVWTNLSTNPIFDDEGRYKGALAMLTNITERKIADEKLQISFKELQKASQHQSAILNALPALVALVDDNGNIIALNQAWIKLATRINAKDPNYFIGGNYLKLAENTKGKGANLGIEIANGTRDVIAGKKNKFTLEYSHINLSGQKRWFKVEVTPLSDKTHSGAVVMHVDITDRKADEEKIIQSNERYRIVTGATNDAIWDWNLLTNQIYFSEGYEKLFGLLVPNQEEDVDTWKNRIHPEDKERVLISARAKIRNPGSDYHWQEEYRFCKNNGSYVHVFARANVIVDENNKSIRVVGAMQDITRRKLAELERDKTTADLIQRNSDLEQFAYIVSHNLRAPVANIIGCTDVLSELEVDEQSHKEIMRGLSTSAKKLDKVIWDLNDILQIKRDLNEKKEIIHFSELVKDIKISISSLIQKEDVTIITNFEAIDEFLSLKTYMYSIFYNLISNSIKYRRQNIPPIIEISSQKLNDKLELTFKDNGMGIDLASKRDQVFGLYKRFHPHIEGKGMGLFMIKTQVEAMRGKISIQSEVNIGTVFTILFDI